MKRAESGAVLIFALLVCSVLIAIVALAVDIGVALYVKQEAVKAAELSARRGVAEMYFPDYEELVLPAGDGAAVPGLDADKWWSQFLEAPARASVRALGQRHTAGWTMASAPYVPNIQLNDPNSAAGDIRLGTWTKAAGGAFSFTPSPAAIAANGDLARAAQVAVRRVTSPQIPGISEGGNPIPVSFAGIFGVTETQQRSTVTAKLDPAAVLGTGALVPRQGGQLAVTGTAPFAFRHNGMVRRVRPGPPANITVRDWIAAGDPATMVQVRVTNDGTAAAGGNVPYAGTAYFVSFPSPLGGTPLDRLRRRVVYLAQKPVPTGDPMEAPPQCFLGLQLNGPGQGDGPGLNNGAMNSIFQAFFRTNRDNDFVNRTWTPPIVVNGGADNRRIAGFIRVYCEGAVRVQNGNNGYFELDLRLAPSACSRNSGPVTTLARLTPAAAPSANVLGIFNDIVWTTDAIDGIRSGPRPFGVACATVSADY